ncbi:DUF6458 family protein [Clavibacter sepedonicus]|nr:MULTISPECIES: DUF6458 family protein [Clavibacter]MBD5381674.1 hypothetical protein [Clavibacter sp.]OQJ47234.1 hypothetical protein B5P19_02265 [Clavibacter sepedonicus]OQJ52791.1 hypothetical protein B5P20_00525 [Clavibacter sepedonicus]UUK66784.1 DUF6458 family protein [Clavibacter sepedonicus]
MSIGLGIFLVVLRAILAFAVDITVPGVDLQLVGYILMGSGALVIIIGVALLARRRTAVSETRTSIDPATGQRVTRRERSDDNLI